MGEDRSQLFASFLERSLLLIEREAPEHFVVVRERMRGLAVAVAVGRASAVRVQLDVSPWIGACAHAELWVAIDQPDLVAVLSGRLSIEEALDGDRLLLRGELDNLLRLFDALDAWLHGAVRCASMAALHHEYLRLADCPGQTSSEPLRASRSSAQP